MSNNKIEPNHPINPVITEKYTVGNGTYGYSTYYGLTKREYFAGIAMQSLINTSNLSVDEVCRMSVGYANVLIEKLNKD